MPTTLLSLALLLILLGPGFCYIAAHERRFPSRQQSPFRESVQIAAASIVLNLLSLAGFWAARTISSRLTPDVAALVSQPHQYWLMHFRFVFGWAIGLFTFACLLGFISGALIPPRKGSVHASAWFAMFEVNPGSQKWIGCELLDGAYVSGQLYSYSLDSEETEDRELIIREPKYQAAGQSSPVSLESALTTVSARQIKFLSVNYRSKGAKHNPGEFRSRVSLAWKILRGSTPAQVQSAAGTPS
jgi:hypothetical protein